MKYSIFILLTLFICCCKPKASHIDSAKTSKTANKNSPIWLIGNWERIGEKDGNQTYEYWKQDEDGNFIGMGCTLNGADTIWKEDVLLAKDDTGWRFEVVGQGEPAPTVFKVTQLEENRFICENDENEFPKKIEYAYDGKNINAVISGGGPTIPFNFIRMKQ